MGCRRRDDHQQCSELHRRALSSGSSADCGAKPQLASNGLTFNSISAGNRVVCGVTNANVAYCWGYGALGDGTSVDSYAAQSRHTPSPVAGSLRFKVVRAGHGVTCGVAMTGDAYCWGSNTSGALRVGHTDEIRRLAPERVAGGLSFVNVSPGWSTTCGLTTDGRAFCWA